MKLQVIIPGKRLTVELPEETCERRFADFASQLLFEELPEPCTKRAEHSALHKLPAAKTAYFLQCPHCGGRNGFTWNGILKNYHCRSCHMASEIDHDSLAKIDFSCECGMQEMYLTNVTDEGFEMRCYLCRMPVNISYDDAVGRFGAEDKP